MSDPLSPNVTGDLEGLGLGASRGVEEEAPEVTEEAQAQAVESAPEPEQEVQEAAPEEGAEFDQFFEAPQPTEHSEVDRLKHQVALLEGQAQGRREAVEDQIRNTAAPAQPVQEENYFDSPAIQAVLSQYADDPEIIKAIHCLLPG